MVFFLTVVACLTWPLAFAIAHRRWKRTCAALERELAKTRHIAAEYRTMLEQLGVAITLTDLTNGRVRVQGHVDLRTLPVESEWPC
jgi:hypothetical protein